MRFLLSQKRIRCTQFKYDIYCTFFSSNKSFIRILDKMSTRQSLRIQAKIEKQNYNDRNTNNIQKQTSFHQQYYQTIQKFMQALRNLHQFHQQPIEVQRNHSRYPFILHCNNNSILAHLGEGPELPVLGAEKLQASQACYFQYLKNYYENQQKNLNTAPNPQNPEPQIKIEEEQPKQDPPIQQPASNPTTVVVSKPIKTEGENDSVKFTNTPFLSIINLPQEASKVRQRYRARQEGQVVKRIRKSKIQVQEELKDGMDPKETKNIPKNYAKAIMTYLLKNTDFIDKYSSDPDFKRDFVTYLQNMKLTIQNIKQFKAMLTDQEPSEKHKEYNRIFRIISRYFLRKKAVQYIFNSRITQKSWHIKYRNDLLRAVHDPIKFRKVKPKKNK